MLENQNWSGQRIEPASVTLSGSCAGVASPHPTCSGPEIDYQRL
jgi:hypothetical protein